MSPKFFLLVFGPLFLAVSPSLANSSKASEPECFCKALCFFEGSSDYYKIEDVDCKLPMEKQKELMKPKLLKHTKSKHGELTWEQVKPKVEIMCYKSKKKMSK